MRDAHLQAKVSRLRQLLAEAIPAGQNTPQAAASIEEDAWRAYQAFAANDPLPAHDDSRRAKATRKINRIALRYGWASEIQRFLDHVDRSSISALDDFEVERLLERMVALEDCLRDGCDPPDMPAAR